MSATLARYGFVLPNNMPRSCALINASLESTEQTDLEYFSLLEPVTFHMSCSSFAGSH